MRNYLARRFRMAVPTSPSQHILLRVLEGVVRPPVLETLDPHGRRRGNSLEKGESVPGFVSCWTRLLRWTDTPSYSLLSPKWGPALYICYKMALSKGNTLVYEAGKGVRGKNATFHYTNLGFGRFICWAQSSREGPPKLGMQ